MPYVIKVDNGYVKTGKEDTENLDEAKQFKTEKQAKTFAFSNCAGSFYRVVNKEEEKEKLN